MMRLWFSEKTYVEKLNLLCEYLNNTKGWPVREVKYWSWKFHYIETLDENEFYSASFKSPMDAFDEIMKIAFTS